ncbi:lytic murein transglycosylase B [Jeongeupia naejangsanensis]|uniref:Lytic murein transglycosylase B n=1 Tax=Jeongeupia naejangsanensis TaxID=613195 RepID=A0ABS2BFN2_9NEIS|nr:lytic murein transglycosylase B [Jeongeupia naejangsanensis]MBM3114408.1 lytic murein transglycosylase B [Jeongeupia naejangsanensis]
MRITLLSTLLSFALVAPAVADDALITRPDVKQYLDEVAASENLSRDKLDTLFANVQLKPNIISILDRPSTSRPWYQFRGNFVNPTRIKAGAKFWRAHADTLAAVSARYGVSPEVIVAILGAETNYGSNTGSFRVIDALSTVAFDYPRRADFFRKELTQFLLLAREEGEDPLSFKGSYAGAMGWPQFMPSSFRQYAVDWNGDHHRDIWNNADDAIASVGNYLAAHGWEKGGPTMDAVNVDSDQVEALLADKFNLHYTVAEMLAKGIAPLTEVDPQRKAVLFALDTEPDFTRYYLGYTNFYVITRYNKSTLYASAVLELADGIKSAYLSGDDAGAAPKKAAPVKSSGSWGKPKP